MSPMLAARLVVPDNGEILEPQNAPETMAPAVKPGLICNVVPIPIKAIPIVETVVKELPQATPTNVHTIKTVGKKNLTEMISNPKYIIVGIVPEKIQVAIKTPIDKKIIKGSTPARKLLRIPFIIVSHLKPRNLT